MDLISFQMKHYPLVDHYYSRKISVLITDETNDYSLTLASLKEQIYFLFNFKVIDCSYNNLAYTGDWQNPYELFRKFPIQKVLKTVEHTPEEYILIIQSGMYLLPAALLQLIIEIEKKPWDVVYFDEMFKNENGEAVTMFYPGKSPIFYSQENVQPKCMLFKKSILIELLISYISEKSNPDINDLFRDGLNLHNSKHLDFILATGDSSIQKWVYSEPYYDLNSKPAPMDFLIVVENFDRSLTLANKLKLDYPNSNISFAVKNNDFKPDSSTQKCYYTNQNDLTQMIDDIAKNSNEEALILLTDDILSWTFALFPELVQSLFEENVYAASPLVLWDDGMIQYAGATFGGIAMYNPLYAGQKLESQFSNPLVRSKREIGLLSDKCICIKRSKWSELYSDHMGIYDLHSLAVELSLKIRGLDKLCLYRGLRLLFLSREKIKYHGGAYIRSLFYNYPPELLSEDSYSSKWIEIRKNHWECTPFELFLCRPQNRKALRVLIVSNELQLTGAPITLLSVASILSKNGFETVVVSPTDGPIRKEFIKLGISVIIDPAILELDFDFWDDVVDGYDLILANTIVARNVVSKLSNYNIPVLWWIHDAEHGYPAIASALPKKLGNNIHIYCVSEYSERIFKKYCPQFSTSLLYYGIEDLTQKSTLQYDIPTHKDKIKFAVIATLEYRKGQDILANAIKSLPEQIREKCVFMFIGKRFDENIYKHIIDVQKLYPENIEYIPFISRDQISSFFEQLDCIVCPSRDDPLPVFIAEGMIFSKVLVCSENTGFSNLIVDGKNGFKYANDSTEELSKTIEYIIVNSDTTKETALRGRKTYEDYLTIDIFEKNLLQILNALLK